MNNIKNIFSIKDLENLSGIKAHTIRIWEKRYEILEPMRTDTNIRYYNTENLQKLLNITLLHNHGYKISKISKFPKDKISEIVREISNPKNANNHAISNFKLAMIEFNQKLFFTTYDELLKEKTFSEVFYEVFVPLISEIGMLWQTGTISPAHEHFISYLIKQKILINTEKVQIQEPIYNDKTFVLYLPENEIHELGLMFLNYEIQNKGYKTIYLGESVPLENLIDVKKYFSNITYICYMTVEPNVDKIDEYLSEIEKISDADNNFLLLGRMAQSISKEKLSNNISVYSNIAELTNSL